MTENMVHLTSRVPGDLISRLEELAKERRKQTGENISRADLVREALEKLVAGASEPAAPSLLDQAMNCPDERESVRLSLDVIALLANDAAQRGLLTNPPQDFGMAVFEVCEGRGDLALLLDYVSKLHGALRAV